MAVEPKLLIGRFSDRGRVQDALDVFMEAAPEATANVDVAFYGSDGEYLLVVAAKDSLAEDWAAQVLRDHGATLQQRAPLAWHSRRRDELMHQAGGVGDRDAEETALRSRWANAAILLIEQGLLEPPDLLALLLTLRKAPDVLTRTERRQRLREADEELRAVAERLEAALRARHPEFFDRQGRLRSPALARYLSERTGGKDVLSGDELRVLEDAADAAAPSGRAP